MDGIRRSSKMKKIVMIIVLIAILFCIGIKVLSYAYYRYSLTNILSGTIVVSKVNTLELVNPNNIKEAVMIDLQPYIKKQKQYLLTPAVTKDGIYFLAIGHEKEDKSTPYSVVKLSNKGYEILPVAIDNSTRQSWGGQLYVNVKYFYIVDGSQVFEVDRITNSVKRIDAGLQTHRGPLSYQNNTPVVYYRDGIIGTNEKNDVIYIHDGKIEFLFSIPFFLLKGWYKTGESFLAYDWQNEKSVVLDMTGKELFTFGYQPYDVLGSQKDGLLLAMMPRGEGGQDFFDWEFSWNNLLDYNLRIPFVPFIYDYKTKNTRLVRKNISLVTNQWQDMDYDKETFEQYRKAAQMNEK